MRDEKGLTPCQFIKPNNKKQIKMRNISTHYHNTVSGVMRTFLIVYY